MGRLPVIIIVLVVLLLIWSWATEARDNFEFPPSSLTEVTDGVMNAIGDFGEALEKQFKRLFP